MFKPVTFLTIATLGAASFEGAEGLNGQNLMRKEVKASIQMHLSPAAHMKEKTRRSKADCDKNYIRGALNATDCHIAGKQNRIENPDDCREAAAEKAGCENDACIQTQANCDSQNCESAGCDCFEVNSHNANKYPKRCSITSDGKWHWNDVEYEPTGLENNAFPVCEEIEYMNGTLLTDGTNINTTKCDDAGEYRVVYTEAECRAAATCETFCQQGLFAVLNSSADKLTTPRGCFIDKDSDCYRFNSLERDSDFDHTKVTGHIPVCKLKLVRGSESIDATVTTAGDTSPISGEVN
jgi:hypothetical protein